MKVVLFAFLLSLPAWAAPLAQQPGTYKFAGYTIAAKKVQENVFVRGEVGGDRVQELKSEGYTCELKRGQGSAQVYQCSKFMPTEGTEMEIADRVQERISPILITFAEATGSPELLSQGDLVEQWRVPQGVQFADRNYPDYSYVIGQGVERILLGEMADETLIVSADRLELSRIMDVSKSDRVSVKYLVLSRFEL